MRINSFTIKDLKETNFFDQFSGSSDLPISTSRLNSYIHNPYAQPEDTILYVAMEGKAVIGYRLCLPDKIQNSKFMWVSGLWVHPSKRGEGIAKKLSKLAQKDWEFLAGTNFAPTSSNLYEKANIIQPEYRLNGYRFYFKWKLDDLLGNRNPFFRLIRPVLKIVDQVGNRFLSQKNKKTNLSNYKLEDNWNEATYRFIQQFQKKELFPKGKETMEWVWQNPWVEESNEKSNFYFSDYAKQFTQKRFTFFNNNEIIAAIWVTIHKNNLKTPYVYAKKGNEKIIAQFIFDYAKEKDCDFLTTYQSNVIRQINYIETNYLFKKKFQNEIKLNQPLQSLLKDKIYIIQDGVGDNVFT